MVLRSLRSQLFSNDYTGYPGYRVSEDEISKNNQGSL